MVLYPEVNLLTHFEIEKQAAEHSFVIFEK